ncbi:excinuclease ABC subunit UvrC, partial [Fibrobacter intestinalis]|uniref:excinuclease ABC subunit UvrC n=2 Tax=Fibrobacter TaxID=832 RepID=UPI0023EFF2EE
MFSEAIQKRLTELPFRPGVYLMKNAAKKVIYVGKAKVLAHRVRSYFDGKEKPGHRAATLMLPYIREIEWIVTDTEEEAFILEANLIRKHKPIYNVRLKDDKHYPYIAIDMRDPFPRLFLSRHASTRFRCFGPYPSSKAFRTLIDISARLFKMRECKLIFPLAKSQRPCLNYHIGRCLAPCANLCSQEEYARNVGEMVKVLEGKRNDLLSEWTREMKEAVQKLDFETAAKKRDAIEALQATTTFQKADTTDTTLKLDVIAVRRNGNLATAVIFEYRQGVISGRRHFQLECDQEQDESE